jgi:hypothetical protein
MLLLSMAVLIFESGAQCAFFFMAAEVLTMECKLLA